MVTEQGSAMASAASPSGAIPATEGSTPAPAPGLRRGLQDLPVSVGWHILELLEKDILSSADELHPNDNPMLPLRRVSKHMRSLVDSHVTSANCYIKASQYKWAGVLGDVRIPLELLFFRDLPRWPLLCQLALRFDWDPPHVQFALRSLAATCPRLLELRLRAEGRPAKLAGPSLAPLSQLPSLKVLSLDKLVLTGASAELPSIPTLEELLLVDGGPWPSLESAFPALRKLHMVRHLDIQPTTPQPLHLQSSTALETLHIRNNTLGDLTLPASVKSLSLENILVLGDTSWVLDLPLLQKLSIERIFGEDEEKLISLTLPLPTGLTSLSLLENDGVRGPPRSLSHLTALRSLRLSEECGRVPDLSALPYLETLELRNYEGLSLLTSTSVVSLQIEDCKVLPPLLDMPHLTALSLKSVRCAAPRLRLPNLRGLTSLVLLGTGLCLEEPLSSWEALASLKVLKISTWHAKVPDLGAMRSLEELELDGYANLPEFASTSLKSLTIHACPVGPSLPKLRRLVNLSTLRLSSLATLTKLGAIRGLPSLVSLIINDMDVKTLVLTNPTLKLVKASWCPELHSIDFQELTPRPKTVITDCGMVTIGGRTRH